MSILAVAASEAAGRSENKVDSGTGALEVRAGSSVARTSTNNCVRVAISMARSSRVGLERMYKMYNGRVWEHPYFCSQRKQRVTTGRQPQAMEASSRMFMWAQAKLF